MKKRIMAALLAAAMIVSLCACGNDGGDVQQGGNNTPATPPSITTLASFDDFDIPGFSSQVAGTAEIRPAHKSVQQENNSLTDTEYAQFKKNLATYPLNLRIAGEEFIVNNKFKRKLLIKEDFLWNLKEQKPKRI